MSETDDSHAPARDSSDPSQLPSVSEAYRRITRVQSVPGPIARPEGLATYQSAILIAAAGRDLTEALTRFTEASQETSAQLARWTRVMGWATIALVAVAALQLWAAISRATPAG